MLKALKIALFVVAACLLPLAANAQIEGDHAASPVRPSSLSELNAKARAGDATAQRNLGKRYQTGDGVRENILTAVRWYRLAAMQGDQISQLTLAEIYGAGEGVKRDAVEAVKWLRKAAEQGNASAQAILGLCYLHGEGVPKDQKQGVNWLEKAAKQLDPDAQRNLGFLHLTGRGVVHDDTLAWTLFLQSETNGDAVSEEMVGYMYEMGLWLQQDYAKAASAYRSAGDKGIYAARYRLGLLYARGRGVERDETIAKVLWKDAADNGITAAKVQLSLWNSDRPANCDWFDQVNPQTNFNEISSAISVLPLRRGLWHIDDFELVGGLVFNPKDLASCKTERTICIKTDPVLQPEHFWNDADNTGYEEWWYTPTDTKLDKEVVIGNLVDQRIKAVKFSDDHFTVDSRTWFGDVSENMMTQPPLEMQMRMHVRYAGACPDDSAH